MQDLLAKLPFNHQTFDWSAKNFDSTYRALWIPQHIPTLIFAGDADHLTPLDLFLHAPEFQRKNILVHEIKNAAHFPWVDNPEQVEKEFLQFSKLL